LVKETLEFFKDESKVSALLDLIFSPLDPRETDTDRDEYQRRWELFEEEREVDEERYKSHEERANVLMFEAIRSLPEDLYDEAISPESVPLAESLQFHWRYRNQILRDLADRDKKKLQVFRNLMHIRFPHSDAKARNPGLFWISESKAKSRQQLAHAEKKNRGKTRGSSAANSSSKQG